MLVDIRELEQHECEDAIGPESPYAALALTAAGFVKDLQRPSIHEAQPHALRDPSKGRSRGAPPCLLAINKATQHSCGRIESHRQVVPARRKINSPGELEGLVVEIDINAAIWERVWSEKVVELDPKYVV